MRLSDRQVNDIVESIGEMISAKISKNEATTIAGVRDACSAFEEAERNLMTVLSEELGEDQ